MLIDLALIDGIGNQKPLELVQCKTPKQYYPSYNQQKSKCANHNVNFLTLQIAQHK